MEINKRSMLITKNGTFVGRCVQDYEDSVLFSVNKDEANHCSPIIEANTFIIMKDDIEQVEFINI